MGRLDELREYHWSLYKGQMTARAPTARLTCHADSSALASPARASLLWRSPTGRVVHRGGIGQVEIAGMELDAAPGSAEAEAAKVG